MALERASHHHLSSTCEHERGMPASFWMANSNEATIHGGCMLNSVPAFIWLEVPYNPGIVGLDGTTTYGFGNP